MKIGFQECVISIHVINYVKHLNSYDNWNIKQEYLHWTKKNSRPGNKFLSNMHNLNMISRLKQPIFYDISPFDHMCARFTHQAFRLFCRGVKCNTKFLAILYLYLFMWRNVMYTDRIERNVFLSLMLFKI